VKGQGKLNRHIIFESLLMLFAKIPKIIKISPYLSKLQLAKVLPIFNETHQCIVMLDVVQKSTCRKLLELFSETA